MIATHGIIAGECGVDKIIRMNEGEIVSIEKA